ncbi:hypothetical protein CROQUDRAFT_88667 [Cronartium quercuum f. sp. fusiforme G11]|uniref:Uncharacterized protein n=1 Tax=Cronartium quercuum f. sp. fusiforme G11 TaxID=708437 RepID=A0A9P6TFK2_9BASI|nr:hypothetical protein CROQUDRAFT_88667 [Cronartium quercuum f. sp. fusiforme G11]
MVEKGLWGPSEAGRGRIQLRESRKRILGFLMLPNEVVVSGIYPISNTNPKLENQLRSQFPNRP